MVVHSGSKKPKNSDNIGHKIADRRVASYSKANQGWQNFTPLNTVGNMYQIYPKKPSTKTPFS